MEKMSRAMPVRICTCGSRWAPEVQPGVPAFPPRALPGDGLPHSKAGEKAPNGPSGPHGIHMALALPPPEGYCCCFKLRHGCLFIAVLFAVIAIASLVLFTMHPKEHEFNKDNERTVHFAYRLFAVLAGLKILLSLMLFIGILRERMEFVRPWLISYFIVCPVEGTSMIAAAFVAMLVEYWALGVTLLICSVCYIVLYGFLLYVVYRYYTSIADVAIIEI